MGHEHDRDHDQDRRGSSEEKVKIENGSSTSATSQKESFDSNEPIKDQESKHSEVDHDDNPKEDPVESSPSPLKRDNPEVAEKAVAEDDLDDTLELGIPEK